MSRLKNFYNNKKSNKSEIRLFILLFFILITPISDCLGQSQLKGKVYSAKDSTAIFGASIYFDGTSIGVSTNEQGSFSISFQKNNSSLVISSIGYEPVVLQINDFEGKNNDPIIYLKEKLEELNTVFLETDPWSRLRKLGVFRREFLGSDLSAQSCKIINEDAIKLRYIPSTKTLLASSSEPLIIKNKFLGYLIRYNLTNFEVKFEMTASGLIMPFSTYYEGYSFFEPLKKKLSKKVLKNRNTSYLGSSLHFMRSLYSEELDENNFKIFHERFQVPTYKYFQISSDGNMRLVKLLVEEIAILHDGFDQSGFTTLGEFKIDYLGNYSPPQAIIFKGEMSKDRISEFLPLDYTPEL